MKIVMDILIFQERSFQVVSFLVPLLVSAQAVTKLHFYWVSHWILRLMQILRSWLNRPQNWNLNFRRLWLSALEGESTYHHCWSDRLLRVWLFRYSLQERLPSLRNNSFTVYGVAHLTCNLCARSTKFLVFLFFNLLRYDARHFINYPNFFSDENLLAISRTDEI